MPIDWDSWKDRGRRNLLTLLTLAGTIAGLVLGFGLRAIPREEWWTKREVMYIQFPGDIYLRLLKMFVLPLLVTSVVSGIAALNIQACWKVAARSALWFVVTEYIAVVTGIMLAVSIRPGVGAAEHVSNNTDDALQQVLAVDTALDIFRNTFPPNYIAASLTQVRTVLISPQNDSIPLEEWPITMVEVKEVNIPGLITLAICLGLAVGVSLPSGQPLLDFCNVLGKCMMIAIGWALWYTPIAVLFMVAGKLLEEEDLSGLLERLGLYFMTVMTGLFVHGLITLPAIYFAFTRKSPFKLLLNVAQALATAFGTASSNAALPVTMNCLEKRAKLDPRVVRFIAPVATTMNMDGTALYEATAVVFISQLRGVNLDFANLLLISITVTAACIGNAGVPQAGLVTMVLILSSLGLNGQDVTLIVAIDWLLDRFRTTVNVMSDAFAAGVVEHLSQDQLAFIGQRKYSEIPQIDDDGEEYELNIRL